MARIRTIKPEIWTSEQFVELSLTGRLLFIGMWNFCDDNGVHRDSPKVLKMEVFPAEDINIETMGQLVDELVSHGLVERFEAEGQSFLWVTGWHHQRIDKSKAVYKFPEPPGAKPAGRRGDDKGTTTTQRKGKEGKGKEGKVKEDSPPADAGGTSEGQPVDHFAAFWSAYPSRGQHDNPRKPAQEKFNAAVKRGEDPEIIVAGAVRYAAYCRREQKDPQYIAQAVTWLNQERWKQANGGDDDNTGYRPVAPLVREQNETYAAAEARGRAGG